MSACGIGRIATCGRTSYDDRRRAWLTSLPDHLSAYPLNAYASGSQSGGYEATNPSGVVVRMASKGIVGQA